MADAGRNSSGLAPPGALKRKRGPLDDYFEEYMRTGKRNPNVPDILYKEWEEKKAAEAKEAAERKRINDGKLWGLKCFVNIVVC